LIEQIRASAVELVDGLIGIADQHTSGSRLIEKPTNALPEKVAGVLKLIYDDERKPP
jgi:hypothetical protein